METKFNFNSQVCTSKVQSERLLALGLKKETADMSYTAIVVNHKVDYRLDCSNPKSIDIPAWSLHRLWELSIIKDVMLDSADEIAVLYDEVINKIEELIKGGNFPKEYLV